MVLKQSSDLALWFYGNLLLWIASDTNWLNAHILYLADFIQISLVFALFVMKFCCVALSVACLSV